MYLTKLWKYNPSNNQSLASFWCKVLLILCFFFLSAASIAATDSSINKLQQQLIKAQTEKEQIEAYRNFCWYYRYISLDSCLKYGNLGIKLSKKIKEPKSEAELTRFIAISYWHYALEEESLEWIYQSKKISEQIDDKEGVAYCYDNIGNIFYSQNILDKAMLNFKQGREIFATINNNRGVAYSMLHCGWVFLEQKNYDSAFYCVRKAISLRTQLKDTLGVSIAFYDLGNVFRGYKNYDSALICYRISIDAIKKSNLLHNLAGAYHYLSETFRQINHFDSCQYYANLSLKIAEGFKNYRQIIKTTKTLMLMYEQKGDYKDAYILQQKHFETKEKLINEKISLKLKRKQLEQEFEVEATKIRARENYIITGVIVLLIVAIIVIFIIYKNHSKTRLYNKILELKNEEIQKQTTILEEQTEELKKLNDVKNKMFSVVSHDIRSPLASLRSMLDLYNKKAISITEISSLMPEITSQVNNTSTFVDNLLYWSKTQFSGIHIHKEQFDINQTIEREIQVSEFAISQKKLNIITTFTEGLKAFADENMIAVVIRNLIANALKFSNMYGNIEISTSKREDKYALIEVVDYGRGMTVQQINQLFITSNTTEGTLNEKGTGLGLLLSKEFIEKNNGKIWVESVQGDGSRFFIELPID